MASLATVDWEHARLQLTPTLRMRIVTTNCAELWSALGSDGAAPPASLRLATPVALTVWREELSPRFLSVSAEEHQALVMAGDGIAFGSICELLIDDDRDADAVAALAGAMLARWMGEGVLIGVA